MKAIGATREQVAGMYLVLILGFGVIALILAIPLSAVVSYASAQGIAVLVNVDLQGFRIPTPTLILEILVGLGVPLLAGLIPVLNGARMTVREAITNYGISAGSGRGWFDRLLEQVRGMPRPMLLSLRNTFRRKARLALTLFTLMLGGAIFIAVFNLQASLYRAIDVTFGYILTDVNVVFQRQYRMERVQDVVQSVPGVVTVEGWGNITGRVYRPDGTTSDQVQMISPPATSHLIKPVLTSGRWLIPGDENAIVVGNHFIKLRPDVKLGDLLKIQINNKDYEFQVVGVYEMAGTVFMPIVYVNNEYIQHLLNEPGQVYSLRVVTDRHDNVRQDEVAKALTSRFEAEGFKVGTVMTGAMVASQSRIMIDILIGLLLFMAVLIAIVGGLGLMGTMGMNVMERTREIGVMRSIGAVNGSIMQIVIGEGMMIGLISWAMGALLSIPIAQGLGYLIGVALLNVPLQYRFSTQGLVIWVILVIVLSAVSCILPARNATRLTVRDVLAYE
jgi:putative ABC transport system permease protein